MEEVHVKLSRLNCQGCVRSVTKALQKLPGIEIINADIPSKMIHLRYAAEQTTLDAIKIALAEAQYPAISTEVVH